MDSKKSTRLGSLVAIVPMLLGVATVEAGCSSSAATTARDGTHLGVSANAIKVSTPLDPTVHGFRFVNDFQNYVNVGAGFDIRTGGLCGGMSYAVLDYYYAHIPIPAQWYRPAEGTPLQSYIYGRQVTSIVSNLDRWIELNFNTFGWRDSEFFKWGLQGSNGGRLEELQKKIDAGQPAALGLRGVHGGADHQVLAIGYDLGAYKGDLGANEGDLKIYILDPNFPQETKVLIPILNGEYYTYQDNPGDQKWSTYFVDQNYHAQTPPVINEPPDYRSDTLVHELVFTLETGSDDMRGGNDNINVSVNLVDGTHVDFPNINQSNRWISNYTQYVRIVLPTPLPEANILSVTLTDTFGGGVSGDNWDMNSLQIDAVVGSPIGTTHHPLLMPKQGFKRFTGDDQSLTVLVSQPANLVTNLMLTIRTGGDNLGDNGNRLDATIQLHDGTADFTPNLNNGGHWDNDTTHTVTLFLPKPVLPSALSALKLAINKCGGISCDNWNMDNIAIQAKGNGIDRAVGSYGFNRFTGTDNTLTIPLDGGTDVCVQPVALTMVPATAQLTYCGGPISLAVPTAGDPCTKTSVPVVGAITSVNGAPASINVNPDGTVTSPVATGTIVVTWHSTNTTGAQATQTQTVTLVNPGPTLKPWPMTNITACAGSTSAVPLPTVQSDCSGASVSGSIVATNGTTLSTPIPIAPNGSVPTLPAGDVSVIWTGTDGSAVSTHISQTFHVTSSGPCLGGPGGVGGWTSVGGTISAPQAPLPPGGPATAIQVNTPPAGGSSWTAITSPNFSTVGLTQGAFLKVDVYIPANANPWWLGDFQALLSVPSANVYSDYLGIVQFMSPKLPVGQWSTVKLPLNNSVLGTPHNDAHVELDLNVTAGTGPWYIGNFRFEN